MHTKYSSNIGSTARALANFGGGRLILVNPQTSINSKARKGAAGAQKQLENRTTYSDIKEFYSHEKNGIHIALSKRIGKNRASTPLEQTLNQIKQTASDDINLYIYLGPEDNGLSNEDMELCNNICYLPAFGEFNSLNLSQAALLALYIVSHTLREGRTVQPIKSHNFSFPDEVIKNCLSALGFDLNAPKKNAYLTLKNILLRSHPSPDEIGTLKSIFFQTHRKLKK